MLANFLDADGRLHTIPSKRSKLLVVLDFLAQAFEPGLRYPESRVNEILSEFHPDHAALRRYLVENGFLDRADKASDYDPLTPRELEVLKLVAEGRSSREIAELLVVSIKTVERHRADILHRLGLRDRVGLTRYAIRRGLIEP